jgi:hypothetical protein
MFTVEDIQARVRKQPFVPIRIVTSAGEAFEVHHPDLIMVGLRDVTVGFASAQYPSVYDKQTRLSLLHITALEDLPAKTALGKNGQQ